MAATSIGQPVIRPIRQLRRTQSFYKFLFRKLGLPLSVADSVIKGLKYAWNPGQGKVREEFAEALPPVAEAGRLQSSGYVTFTPDRFRDIERVIATCRAECDENAEVLRARADSKNFLISVVKDAGFIKLPDVFGLATSRELIDLASVYFGRVPVLAGMSLWWTPPNDTFQQSQMFHCDREDRATLKIFFNIEPVTRDNGPFTLLPAEASDRVRADLDYHKRLSSRVTDEEFASLANLDDLVTLTGGAGLGACVDTSRCFHYGSRGNTEPRLVLMIKYSDYLVPYADIPDWYSALRKAGIELDDYQKLALGLKADGPPR
ncbi:MAG: hypothetical protein ACR2PM_09315 [Hyphomicrobiales bacterium]